MQVNSVTELLGIANYKVAYIVHHSEKKIEVVVQPQESKPCVCSGYGKVHNTTVHSVDIVRVEDLPISGKRVFLHVSKRKSLCLVRLRRTRMH